MHVLKGENKMKYGLAVCGMVCLIIGGSNLEYASEFNTTMCVIPWIIAGVILAIPLFVSAIKGEC